MSSTDELGNPLNPEAFAQIMRVQQEDLELLSSIAERIGYGRCMQYLSEEWRKKDPHGALSVGPAYGSLKK